MTPTENPDHYKYMPRRPGEPEEPAPQAPSIEPVIEADEIVEILTVVEPSEVEAKPNFERNQPHKKETADELTVSEGSMAICKGVLKFFYDFFNPLLIPAYATILIFELSVLAIIAPGAALWYTLTVFGATCILPLLTLFILRRIGAISSIGLFKRTDRLFPYIIEFLALGGMTLFFVFKSAALWIWLIYCGATITAFINLLINFRLRVSCHCSAIAALLATLIAINGDGIPHATLGWWAIGAVIIAGLIGSGAILLGKHRIADVIVGYATGFLPIVLLTLIR